MGYNGRLDDKLKVQNLRRQGLSYKEILGIIPASKDTISRWCRDIELTEEQKLRLYKKKKDAGLRGCIIGAKKQQQTKQNEISRLMDLGIKDIGTLSKRDRFIIGISLYIAEGTKSDGKCEFTNADPRLIKFMSEWFRQFCKVDDDKFRGALWLHNDLDENKAKLFWSSLTNIPMQAFHKTYRAENKLSSNKIRKNIHQYGVFSIRFSDVNIHRKMMGWISGLVGKSMV